MSYTEGALKTLRAGLLINGFTFIDDHLQKTLEESLDILKTNPSDMEYLIWNYFE